MDTQGLRLDQAPPLGLPLRFFLTAPAFAAAAGLLLVHRGPGALVSRWTPESLAGTHLLALGFLGQVLVGALLQMLPVVVGASVPRVGQVAPATHLALTLGTILLSAGLLGVGTWALGVGAVALGLGLGVALVAVALALARGQGAATLTALRLSAIALALTVQLGLALAGALLGWLALPDLPAWVQVHLSWGIFGWAGLAVLGVAYRIVPLFHVTPDYPGWTVGPLAPVVLLALSAGSGLALAGFEGPSIWAYRVLAIGFALFAVATLWVQSRRARPRLDPTLIHWRIAMVAVLAAALASWFGVRAEVLGVLLLFGFGVGLPSGMLLKIVPFLCWLHLQSTQVALGRFDVRVPHMHRLLPERPAFGHTALHGLALVLLVAAVYRPELTRPAGLALTASAFWLLSLLGLAASRYRRAAKALRMA